MEFCPVLSLAAVFAFGGDGAYAAAPGSLVVQRSAENGGEKSYASMDELVADYQDGSLHPGDLKKHAMVAIVSNILDTLAAAIKADPAATQAAKTLKALLKKKL